MVLILFSVNFISCKSHRAKQKLTVLGDLQINEGTFKFLVEREFRMLTKHRN